MHIHVQWLTHDDFFAVAAGDSDMKKVGNTFLQVKLVLNKGVGTEEVFMGKHGLIQDYQLLVLQEGKKSETCSDALVLT